MPLFLSLCFLGGNGSIVNQTGGVFQRRSKRIRNLMGLHPKAQEVEMSDETPINESWSVSADSIGKEKVLTDITNCYTGSSSFLPSLETAGIFV